MKKIIMMVSMLVVLFLAACADQGQQVRGCTKELKICPDGSSVGRTGDNCEFEACPTQAGCDYNSEEKSYVGKSAEECATIRFTCIEGKEYFADECGCGCKTQEKQYIFTDPEECRTALFQCASGEPFFDDDGCGCKPAETAEDKEYFSTNPEECNIAAISCMAGKEAFVDDLGCGCKTPESSQPGKLKATDCTPEQKQAEICTMEYNPVCGWFDSTQIQCIKYPCASTFGNVCTACADENVVSWTQGECPE